MPVLRFLFFLFPALLVAACATAPTSDIKVRTEVDPKANLAGYHSYAWLGSAGILNDPDRTWKPVSFDIDAVVRGLIDEQLQKKGIMPASGQPDLLVGYALGIDMKALEIKQDPKTKFTTLENVPKGALVVVLVDADTGYTIWAGEAVANIRKERKDDEEARQRLAYAIRKMFSEMKR